MRKPPVDHNKMNLLRKMANAEKLVQLQKLAEKSPLKAVMLNCIVCGKSADGLIRCQKHVRKLEQVWFPTTQAFLATFKGQE